MRAVFRIGDHDFVAPTLLDATRLAVDKARELLKQGCTREANELYGLALNQRRTLNH